MVADAETQVRARRGRSLDVGSPDGRLIFFDRAQRVESRALELERLLE